MSIHLIKSMLVTKERAKNKCFPKNLIIEKGNKMKQISKILTLALIVTMFLTACTPATKSTDVPASSNAIQVTEADQGKEYTLNLGDSLIVVLESNPSTGFNWEVVTVENPVLQSSGEPVFKADSEKLGAPGKTTFTFNAVNSGTQELKLIYYRSFEKDIQPEKTFSINVTVSGSAEISNPAAKYCVDQGFTSETRTTADGSQYGVCKFPGGSECDEWAYFRSECKEGQYTVAPTPVSTDTK